MIKKIKKFKKVVIALLAITVALLIFIQSHDANTNYHFRNYSLSSQKLPEKLKGFTIAYISDLNISDKDDLTRMKDIVKDINAKEADMILFGGDIYDSQIFENNQVSNILRDIKSRYGKFAVLGEKDQVDSNACSNILTEAGFEILHNESRTIYYNDTSFQLLGLENNGDCSAIINKDHEKDFKVAFVHQPDYFVDVQKSDIQLQLSGHTLGGYVRIPFFGGISTRDLGEKYVSRKHKENGTTLIVSDGVSKESDQQYRILTKDEIDIITLK